jgi:hypothetical protein
MKWFSRLAMPDFLRTGLVWIAGGIVFGVLTLIGLGAATAFMRGGGAALPAPEVTVIAFPSAEPPTATVTASPATATPTPAITPASIGGPAMRVGDYVEVTGTGGEGLRLRDAPGIHAGINLLAFDSEVFQIRQGPQDADGHTWYELISPSDPGRSGWAVSDFLQQSTSP